MAGMTRPDIAQAVRSAAARSHDPYQRHRKTVMQVPAYLQETKGIRLTYQREMDRSPIAYADASYASKETLGDRCRGG